MVYRPSPLVDNNTFVLSNLRVGLGLLGTNTFLKKKHLEPKLSMNSRLAYIKVGPLSLNSSALLHS